MKLKLSVLLAVLSLLAARTALAESLYEMFDGKSVQVFVSTVQDQSKDHVVGSEVLANKLKEALANRKSIRFTIVDAKDQADLEIAATIKDFMWTDHDPVDMLMGVGSAAADAAMIEDYAQLMVDYQVSDVKKGKVLWNESVRATVTKKPMSKADSVPLISEDSAKEFIKHCFGKKKNR